MKHEYEYFIAAGRSLEAVQQWQKARREASDKIEAIRARVGAEAAVNRRALEGFTFAGNPPQGWQQVGKVDGQPYFAPTRRSKAGKELRDEMAALVIPHVELFASLIGMGPYFCSDYRMRYVTFEKVGDAVVIRVPSDKGGDLRDSNPPDATPLKVSEYFAMKEAAAPSSVAA